MDMFNKALKLKIPSISDEVRDIVAGSVLIVFSLFTFISSFPIRKTVVSKIGSDFFPKLISLLLIGIGIFLLLRALIRHWECRKGVSSRSGSAGACGETEYDNSIILTPLLILIYFAVTEYFGFILSTIFYLNFQIRVMQHGGINRGFVLLLSVVFSLVVYFGFIYGFRLYLPFGIIPGLIW